MFKFLSGIGFGIVWSAYVLCSVQGVINFGFVYFGGCVLLVATCATVLAAKDEDKS